MKPTLLLIAVLLVGGCATTSTLEEKVAGTYENTRNQKDRLVFLDNGVWEQYVSGKKIKNGKWKITIDKGHLKQWKQFHFEDEDGNGEVWQIKSNESFTIFDGNLTQMGEINAGKVLRRPRHRSHHRIKIETPSHLPKFPRAGSRR